jgi:hypothetical protein
MPFRGSQFPACCVHVVESCTQLICHLARAARCCCAAYQPLEKRYDDLWCKTPLRPSQDPGLQVHHYQKT